MTETDDATGTYGPLGPLMSLVEGMCEDYEPGDPPVGELLDAVRAKAEQYGLTVAAAALERVECSDAGKRYSLSDCVTVAALYPDIECSLCSRCGELAAIRERLQASQP